MNKKKKWAKILFAITLVVCGMVSIAFTFLNFAYDLPLIYRFSTTVVKSQQPHHEMRVKQDEWPLHLSRQLEIGSGQQRYIVTATEFRGGGLIGVNVRATSPERAEVFATWLGRNFQSSLNESYKSRGLPTVGEPSFDTEADVIERSTRWVFFSLGFRIFLPTLLIISGVVLFLTRG